jgi:hypothetical protein
MKCIIRLLICIKNELRKDEYFSSLRSSEYVLNVSAVGTTKTEVIC